ncbi:hypothetical protein D029_0396B, partial [Vibrio parahaemolyticus 970107]
TIT